MSPPTSTKHGNVGLFAAVSIGIGGMIGAGIFSILGVVATVSGTALPVAFVIGGAVALLAAYSYTKLGVRYPSAGGSVQFLVQGLGDGVLTGGLNIFQYLAYVISIALYAAGFAGYAMTFLPDDTSSFVARLLAAGIIVVFVGINFLGSAVVGKAESLIVAIKVLILVGFIVASMFSVDAGRLAPSGWAGGSDILFAAGILFIGYEGFGLITNAAADMANPRRELPRAIYLAVTIVILIYVLVSIGVIGNLPIPRLEGAKDYALAEAAEPFLGQFGFKLIAVAALLSTSSAVNATLFGASNVSYQIARDGQLPKTFTRAIWNRHVEGLFITGGLAILFVLTFDLGPIAMMASASFL
ncbi:MAG: APC family permease, partial [Ilumatobacteraceae bacterium]